MKNIEIYKIILYVCLNERTVFLSFEHTDIIRGLYRPHKESL